MRFCPRTRSLHRHRIYRTDPARDYGVYAAFPAGHATASAALAAAPTGSSNGFYAANRELGRALKTKFVLQYMSEPDGRRAGLPVRTPYGEIKIDPAKLKAEPVRPGRERYFPDGFRELPLIMTGPGRSHAPAARP